MGSGGGSGGGGACVEGGGSGDGGACASGSKGPHAAIAKTTTLASDRPRVQSAEGGREGATISERETF